MVVVIVEGTDKLSYREADQAVKMAFFVMGWCAGAVAWRLGGGGEMAEVVALMVALVVMVVVVVVAVVVVAVMVVVGEGSASDVVRDDL